MPLRLKLHPARVIWIMHWLFSHALLGLKL